MWMMLHAVLEAFTLPCKTMVVTDVDIDKGVPFGSLKGPLLGASVPPQSFSCGCFCSTTKSLSLPRTGI